MPMRVARGLRVLPYAMLAGLVLVAYGAAVRNGYVWDDRYFLVDFAWLDSLQSALRTAFSPLFMSEAYVRPLPLLTLYVDSLFGEYRAAVSHGVNIALHVVSTFLVFLLAQDALRCMSKDGRASGRIALAAAALFAVHPALSEAVIWVSSRFDLMATLFMLVGLWVATRDALSDRALASWLALLFVASALSKELAVVFPALLAALVVLRGAARNGALGLGVLLEPRWRLAFAGIFAAGLFYLAIRLHVLQGASGLNPVAFSQEQLVRVCATIARYLQLTFVPFVGNAPQHTFVWTAQSAPGDYWLQIAVSVLYAVAVVGLLIRRHPLGWVLAAWSMCYLPVIHIIPINVGNNTVQQRFMYLPTATLLALAPYGVAGLSLSDAARRVVPVLLALLLVASVLVVRSIVPAWAADISLWSWARQVDPASGMARENLIWAYLERGMYAELDREVALLREDGVVTSINAPLNVGVSYYHRGEIEQALSYYEIAEAHVAEATPAQKSALYANMASAYALLSRYEDAASSIEKAVGADKSNHMALANLMAFCKPYDLDLSAFDEPVVRRAQEKKVQVLAVFRERRPDLDFSRLCPESLVAGR